jgi:FkbM family methyltransferase
VPRVQDLEIARVIGALEPCIADVGARGGIDRELVEIAWACTVYGFEPDPAEAARLRSAGAGAWKRLEILPYALGAAAGPGTLHLPESEQGASLLPHNQEMVESFGYENLHVTRRTLAVETVTLDDLRASGRLAAVDFLKIDVEGAELGILASGRSVLATCSALKVETSFLEQRVGQPLIWDVVPHLCDAGFEVVDIRDVHRWRRRPLPAHPFRTAFAMPYSRGQAAQCDLVLLRRPDSLGDAQGSLRLAVLAAALGYFDFAVTLLRRTPRVAELAHDEYGVRLERALSDWSALRGRSVAGQALREQLRGIVPLVRSALNRLPYTSPGRPY